MKPLGCVIMASGTGQRFGGNKLLADFGGRPLISCILKTALNTPGLFPLAVTRHRDVACLCREMGIAVLCHDLPYRNDTIRLGLQALSGDLPLQHEPPSPPFLPAPTLPGCIFCPADQPLLHRDSLCALIQAFSQNPDKICRLGYGEKGGSPVLFGSRFFPELLTLPQGAGGSYLIKKYPAQVILVPARDSYELYDVDTPQDLKLLSAL